VIPVMERARPVDPAGIRFMVTDRDRSDTIGAALSGARRIWDGQAYSLWRIEDPDWAIIADVSNPNGIEPGGMWIGGPRTEFLVVTAQGGPAILVAKLHPGPRLAPETSQFHIGVQNAAGRRQTLFQTGENRLPVNLPAGRDSIAITIEEPVSGSVPANGDIRPLVLRLTGYGIERAGESRR